MTETASPTADPSMSPPASPLYLWIARGLLSVAIVAAAYLLYSSLQGGPVAGCGGEGGCNEVLQSHWSRWGQIPVSAPALAGYLALLLLSFARPTAGQRAVSLALCLTIIGAAVWFVGLQYFVIHHLCKFCLIAHGCGVWAALTLRPRMPWTARVAWNEPVAQVLGAEGNAAGNAEFGREELEARVEMAKGRNAWVVVGIGMAVLFLGVLVGGQSLLPTQMALWEKGGKLAAVHVQGIAPKIVMFDGQVELDLKNVPLVGVPEARRVAVVLFDPTCHFCKDLHRLLQTEKLRYGKDLALVMLPMPLDSRCNSAVTKESELNACDYAKLALAVWRADRKQYETYVDYLMGFRDPPGVDAATERAKALVGEAQLQAALKDTWVAEQLHMDVELFHANRKATGSGAMPQMVMGEVFMQGSPNAAELQERLAGFMKP